MLFLHETHSVIGRSEDEFEERYRGPGGFMESLGHDDDARLLWYVDHVHGTGPAYTVVTVTAVRDGAAWERLVTRLTDGDLREWIAQVDQLRHDSVGKLLRPLPWSPLQHVELSDVLLEPADHEMALFMEDTVNPRAGRIHEYIDVAGSHYAPSLEHANPLLEIVAAFQPAFGAGQRREIVLWQRVADQKRLLRLLTAAVPPELKRPGSWMHDALELRDEWTSRLLRTAPWSPLA